ncbi:MAG: fimbrial protein [Bacteroidales bacterium]
MICIGFTPPTYPCNLSRSKEQNGIKVTFSDGKLTYKDKTSKTRVDAFWEGGKLVRCEKVVDHPWRWADCDRSVMQAGGKGGPYWSEARFGVSGVKVKIVAGNVSPGVYTFPSSVARSSRFKEDIQQVTPVKNVNIKVRVASTTCTAVWVDGRNDVDFGQVKAGDISYYLGDSSGGVQKIFKSLKICGADKDKLNSATLSFSGKGGKEGGLSDGIIASSQDGIGFRITWEDGSDVIGGVGKGSAINLERSYGIDYKKNSIEFGVLPVRFRNSLVLTGHVTAMLTFKVTYD